MGVLSFLLYLLFASYPVLGVSTSTAGILCDNDDATSHPQLLEQSLEFGLQLPREKEPKGKLDFICYYAAAGWGLNGVA